jgi:hypothetical protein
MTDNTQDNVPSLEVTDIQNAIKIIDFACDQGAFKGWNVIKQVNGVRERLNAFAEFVESQKSEEEAAPQASSETA